MKKFVMFICAIIFILKLEASVLTFAISKCDDAIKIAEKISRRALGKATRKAATESLEKAFISYGDDVLKWVEKGGVELLEASVKYGDEVWDLVKKYPQASRAIGFHADEIIPLVRKFGTEVLELEAKTPGISRMIVKEFGDDAVKTFTKIPPEHTTKIIGIGAKCPDNAAKKLLLELYEKAPSKDKFLSHFTPREILVGGVTIAMIISAYKVSGGVERSLTSIGDGIGKSEKGVIRLVDNLTFPVKFFGILISILIGLYLSFRLKLFEKIIRFLRKRPFSQKAKTP